MTEEFWQWWNEALERVRAKNPDLSWDRCAALLLWMFIEGQEAP